MPDGTVLVIGDEASWSEVKHPRDKDGKFTSGAGGGGGTSVLQNLAKKGQVSNSIAVPLLAHGFKQKKGTDEAIYVHPETGTEVKVAPVPEGKKYSSGWEINGKTGAGGVGLKSLLGSLGHAEKTAPKPSDVQAALGALGVGPAASAPAPKAKKVEPPPNFTHPNEKFAEVLNKYGATPVKSTATTQLYALPNGQSILVKTTGKTNWGYVSSTNFNYKIINSDGTLGYNSKGHSASTLEWKMKQKFPNVAAGGAPTPVTPGSTTQSIAPKVAPLGASVTNLMPGKTVMKPGAIEGEPVTSSVMPNGAKVFVGQETGYWSVIPAGGGTTVIGQGQADLNKALSAGPGKVNAPTGAEVTSTNNLGAIELNAGGAKVDTTSYQLASGEHVFVTDNGDWKMIQKDGKVKNGHGQEALNKEFELLHPRGPGGKFQKKPGEVLPSKLQDMGSVLESLGASVTEASQSTVKFKLTTSTGDITVASNPNSHFPKGAIYKGGQLVGQFWDAAELKTKLLNHGAKPQPGIGTSQTAAASKPPVSVGKLKQVGPQLGSNPGGQYVDEATGQKFYIKQTKSEDHARNENLAASLYQLAGTNTFQYRKSEDQPNAVITEMEPLRAKNVSELTPDQRKAARLDFATHVWTANWDAAGLTGDNVGVIGGAGPNAGKVVSLDVGGALAYRAQGGPKAHLFDTNASEWDTLRDPVKNAHSAALFKDMTNDELKASVAKIANINSGQISAAVQAAGYTGSAAQELTQKMVARRDAIVQKLNAHISKPPPPPPYQAPFKMAPFSSTKMSQLNNAAPEYTSGEHAAIKSYTGGGYQDMNRKLRYGYVSGGATNINQLTKWLNKSSMPEDVVVSRRVDSDYASFLKDVASHPGAVFTDLGFASTSLNKGTWSGSVQMFIKVPKGSKAAAVQHISSHSSEYEIIVQRGSRFKVVSYDKKTHTIYCELDQTHLVKEF